MNNIGFGQIPTIQYLVVLIIAYRFLRIYNSYEFWDIAERVIFKEIFGMEYLQLKLRIINHRLIQRLILNYTKQNHL